MPDMSVVIPVYNCERYLAQAIESVLASCDCGELELIVVDDGSTDASGDIARGYPSVTVISQPNRGLGAARNAGLDAASGEYIYFLDSDDYIASDMLGRLLHEARSKDLDCVLFNLTPVYEDDEMEYYFASSYDDPYCRIAYGEVLDGREMFARLVRTGEYRVVVPRQLWRRSFLAHRGCRFPEGIIHEDELFSFKAILSSQRIECFEEGGFFRRYRRGSIMSSSPKDARYYGYFASCCKIARFVLEEYPDVPEARLQLGYLFDAMVKDHSEFEHFPGLDAFPDEDCLTAFCAYVCLKDKLSAAPVQGDEPSDAALMEFVASRERTYLYGAGQWGRRIHSLLADRGLAVDGVLVTDPSDNPAALCGSRVLGAQAALDLVDPAETLVIVCIARGGAELAAGLRQRGFDALWCKELVAGALPQS